MGYFNALGYRFWVKAGTTSSTAPTASSGMTEVLSLTDAGMQGQSDTQEVLDYGSSFGFKKKVVTQVSYSIPMSLNLDLRDPGYKALRGAWMNGATGTTLEWYRESPEMTSAGDPEKCAGIAWVTNFKEGIQAGNIATISFTLEGTGDTTWTPETDAS